MCRDPLLSLCDGVEQEVFQTGEDACLPSPADTESNATLIANDANDLLMLEYQTQKNFELPRLKRS